MRGGASACLLAFACVYLYVYTCCYGHSTNCTCTCKPSQSNKQPTHAPAYTHMHAHICCHMLVCTQGIHLSPAKVHHVLLLAHTQGDNVCMYTHTRTHARTQTHTQTHMHTHMCACLCPYHAPQAPLLADVLLCCICFGQRAATPQHLQHGALSCKFRRQLVYVRQLCVCDAERSICSMELWPASLGDSLCM